MAVMEREAKQIGQEKQLRVHLVLHELPGGGPGGGGSIPVPFGLDCGAGHLEETARAEVAHYLIVYASWTSYLVAVFAVEQVFEWEEREV